MNLNNALILGHVSGLKTVGEAVANIRLHAMNLFTYVSMGTELQELAKAVDGISFDKLIVDVLGKATANQVLYEDEQARKKYQKMVGNYGG